ncbi:MAG TPA: biotin-dependent carboxyltransferase family protein [Mesorhizobium sp.]|jgi:biotin-dependent carboxylase-like uncharacterized protein|nr:biotin-dependent carboxyltransferase family protein [Mesorhizobium sp.]
MLEVLTTGTPNTVQDGGRPGFLDAGVSLGGAMDRAALAIANALAGNPADAAVVEIALFPFRARFLGDMRFATAGALCPAWLDEVPLPPWWTALARAGQVLRIEPPTVGARAYLAVAGGVDVPPVLGSRSTDLKGGFGGFEGRGLKRGDRLPIGAAAKPFRLAEFGVAPPWIGAAESGTPRVMLRVLPAAEHECFAAESRQVFLGAEWTVSREADRQGVRLDGPTLKLGAPLQLFSHGIVSGTVQVPADGRPIIQLADANTAGGYPKIATVIEADLWKLGQARPGAKLGFRLVDRGQAVAAWRALRADVAATTDKVRRAQGL